MSSSRLSLFSTQWHELLSRVLEGERLLVQCPSLETQKTIRNRFYRFRKALREDESAHELGVKADSVLVRVVDGNGGPKMAIEFSLREADTESQLLETALRGGE